MLRRLALLCFLLTLVPSASTQQASIAYRFEYLKPGDDFVHITLNLSPAIPAPAAFVIPRNYPGGYSLVSYDSFVEQANAVSGKGATLPMQKAADGPRWNIGRQGETISRIEYQVNVARMERELLSAVDASKIRSRYLGALGYSVFGYVDGMEGRPVNLRIDAPPDWPVLSSLAPDVSHTSSVTVHAGTYYELADSEVLMGPDLQVRRIPGKIGLVMAVYAEAEEDAALEAGIAREALDSVQAYFGTTPFHQYTVQLELLRPLPGHEYDFSQEHLDSGTFSLSVSRALTQNSPPRTRQATLFNYAHHMVHCWIPKRAYGVGYMPFTWELPPVIDSIWFNEGFGRYAAIQAVADSMPASDGESFRQRNLANLRRILDEAPAFIQEMPLLVLSREASFMYERDFRIGENVFARGGLMAAEIDDRIKEKTEDQKSLRDGLRFLLQRSEASSKPFQTEELAGILAGATGVDVQDIFDRWMNPHPRAAAGPHQEAQKPNN